MAAPARHEATIHEVDFCAQIAAAATQLLSQKPNPFAPFKHVRIEGSGKGNRKRKDLRFYDQDDKIVLCGEVKLPGTPEGRSAFDDKLMQDAAAKADDAGVQYFFTWNVSQFVLFDRSQWDKPLLERRMFVRDLGKHLAGPKDVAREENLEYIKTQFLPLLLGALSSVFCGEEPGWLPPDEIFLHTLESRLDWPVQLTAAYIQHEAAKSKAFESRVQAWMHGQDWPVVSKDNDLWPQLVDNMAKTLAYVWSNRLIFYKALCRRFVELKELKLSPRVKKASESVAALNGFLKHAVERSGDYEPLLIPDADDWATELVFQGAGAIDAWRGLIHALEMVDFQKVPSDILGRIFQKLIGPEERHRYGQHFTGDDAVDLINSFCIHGAADTVLDPACGSGSFLVRAYYRKRTLGPERSHADRIAELFGCDISMYPAHLATLNLAAREIVEEANYPRIARQNFFDFDPAKPFCRVPENAGGAITLPLLDAVVGNPPYVRHENVDKADKKRFGQLAAAGWPGFELAGRSDLYCYFWPQAARLLKPNGYFGFLTSSSWLDVEYGFALQGWMLRHFRILAVMESAAEPWFTDARVKTCATILQRCEDEEVRMSNRVRFVRFDRKLADIFRVVPGQNDAARQGSVEALRAKILTTETDYHDPDMRIIVKSQRDLWEDGVKAGSVLGGSVPVPAEDDEDEDGEQPSEWWHPKGLYSAGKWGRYLRAPDIYFDIMRRFGQQFVPLGEIATIRYGVKSGCDEFFMPSDVTETKLASYKDDRSFREHCGGAPRKEVQAGKLRIIEDGEGVIHPIEATSIAPEIHSARGVDRPIIKRSEVSRVILLVNSPLDKLKANAPWTWRYIQYGAKTIYTSRKSKPVPVPARSFISKRAVWYNLTDQVKPGIAIWPKGQQYRHLVISNPDALVANCRLYDVAVREECTDAASLVAVLNSTLVALCRNFYGRYTGTEGAMETMVLDALLLEVPNPLFATKKVNTRLHAAFSVLSKRSTGDFVEEQLMECHSPERARRLGSGPLQYANELRTSDRRELDDAVFELLGVADAEERSALIDRLYEATARHFREIRVVEIEKSEQKKKSKSKGINTHDLAADIWDAAELSDTTTLVEWLALQPEAGSAVNIPDERPVELSGDLMYSPNVVYFGKPRSNHQEFASRDRAALVALLGHVGLSGALRLPDDDKPCAELKDRIEARMAAARARFRELAESRTSFEPIREQLVDLCQRWYVHGRKAAKS